MPTKNDCPRQSMRVPRVVWVLGFVSLLMDISSEMIHAVLPLFNFESGLIYASSPGAIMLRGFQRRFFAQPSGFPERCWRIYDNKNFLGGYG